MSHCHRFGGVGNEFARNQGVLHADVAHREAVADGNCREHNRNAARQSHALLDGIDNLVEIHVARNDVVLGAHNADQRLADFGITQAQGL